MQVRPARSATSDEVRLCVVKPDLKNLPPIG
ncbi:hypothetical protein J2X71_001557 [Rhizobium sp. 1399]|nr:hypothetical protein [Rhizobium sp. 1399]